VYLKVVASKIRHGELISRWGDEFLDVMNSAVGALRHCGGGGYEEDEEREIVLQRWRL